MGSRQAINTTWRTIAHFRTAPREPQRSDEPARSSLALTTQHSMLDPSSGRPEPVFFWPSLHFLSYTFSFSFTLPVNRRAQIQGHYYMQAVINSSYPPSPVRRVPSFLSREEFNPFFPHRLASNNVYHTHAARRSHQLIPLIFVFANNLKSPTHVRFELY